MKLIINTVILLLAYPLYSQGFNWQYSSRLPFNVPKYYAGVHSSFSYTGSSGNFPFVEDRFTCCEFESGNGYTMKLGVNAEYWFKPLQAILFRIAYSSVNSDFSKVIEFPVILHGEDSFMEQYQYDYSAAMNYLHVNAAYRYKFEHTQLSAIFGANFSYLFSENNSSTESRIGPADKVPTYTRMMPEGKIKLLRNFYTAPELSIAYDISFGNGLYSTVALFSELPLLSMTEESEWRMWQFGLNIAVYRGFIFK